jgi:hypothetical protein
VSPSREIATLDHTTRAHGMARAVHCLAGMKKVEIVQAYGKRIVQIDFDGCSPEQYAPLLEEAERVILQEPPSSVRTLTLVGDTHFDVVAVAELTKFATHVSRHLKGGAMVGLSAVKKVIFGGIKPLYRAPVGVFDDAETAKAWLARS